MVESVDGRRVHGAHHLQNAIEVIELLKDLQDLDDARYDGHTLLHVLRFYDAPEKHEKPLETSTYVSDAALNETHESVLLEPQREVGGVADHSQQVRGVDLLVFFSPNAAHQL